MGDERARGRGCAVMYHLHAGDVEAQEEPARGRWVRGCHHGVDGTGWSGGVIWVIWVIWGFLQYLAGEEGFEPSHAGIKIQCLNQLGDSPTAYSEEIKL